MGKLCMQHYMKEGRALVFGGAGIFLSWPSSGGGPPGRPPPDPPPAFLFFGRIARRSLSHIHERTAVWLCYWPTAKLVLKALPQSRRLTTDAQDTVW